MHGTWGEKLDYSYHTLCPVLVASHPGCVTLSGLRLCYKVIAVKGGLHLFQQKVHNEKRWTLQMSPNTKVTAGTIFILQSPCKTHFCLLPAMCRWSGAQAIFHFMQLVKQPYGRRALAAPTTVVLILHCLKVIRYLLFPLSYLKDLLWNF